MARTTPGLVTAILEPGGNYRCGADLTFAILPANRIITKVAECAAGKGISIDAELLQLMESWMAAHFYTRSDPTYKSRSTLRASGEFNADGSEFLTTAIALDPSGCLAEIMNTTNSMVASVTWTGKPFGQQRTYGQRNW